MTTLLAARPVPLTSPAPGPGGRDRFLAFAFAAADLLLEVSADGTVGFAAGAFNARFGRPPEHFVGQRLHGLFLPADQAALDLALATTALRGRLAPLVLRLSDAGGHADGAVRSGMPSGPGRLCFTIGRLPALPDPRRPSRRAADPRLRPHLAEEWLPAASRRARPARAAGLAGRQGALPAEAQRALQTEIVEVLGRFGGPGSVAGEIAPGRYGLLADIAPTWQPSPRSWRRCCAPTRRPPAPRCIAPRLACTVTG